jgi:hypothetical protein
MTLHDYAELVDYWTDHPPPHLIEAARLGLRPRRRGMPAGAATPPSDALGGLLNAAADGIGRLETLRRLC